ncbi:hypothetical protein F8M41_010816 [Gigaspora margarita]|uniref:Uncharacterized protein n=1 Tax=Gigaspora margarita TaxID=4874 RepID=A0A8H3X012_GIGMA|nr:hypothetical protein F8M41_010816 [Gigaspora margarita]
MKLSNIVAFVTIFLSIYANAQDSQDNQDSQDMLVDDYNSDPCYKSCISKAEYDNGQYKYYIKNDCYSNCANPDNPQ